MQDASFLGPLCAFGASVTWAVGSAGYSRLSRGHSAFAVNFARATVAFPLFFLITLYMSGGPVAGLQRIYATPLDQIGLFAISILASYGIGDVLFMWSTRSLGVPAALAIGSTYPLLTAGVGALVQGETLAPTRLAGLLLTVGGVITVILSAKVPTPASSEGAHSSPQQITKRWVGVALAFGTMVCWAVNSIASSRSGKDLDPFLANTFRMGFALVMSAGFSRILSPGTEIAIPWRLLRKSLPLFFFEAFGGSLLFIYGLSHSPLAIGSTLASLAPVLSVPVAVALRLERFSLPRTLGVCTVVIGLWLLVGAIQ